LEVVGVDTVPELAQRNAANLTAKMDAVNEAKNLTRKTAFCYRGCKIECASKRITLGSSNI